MSRKRSSETRIPNNVFTIETSVNRSYILKASSIIEQKKWIELLKTNIATPNSSLLTEYRDDLYRKVGKVENVIRTLQNEKKCTSERQKELQDLQVKIMQATELKETLKNQEATKIKTRIFSHKEKQPLIYGYLKKESCGIW